MTWIGDSDIAKHVIVPVLVSLIVGAFSSWMTMRVTMARFEEQMGQITTKVSNIESRVDKLDKQTATTRRNVSDRLTSLETKIDLLLEGSLNLNKQESDNR